MRGRPSRKKENAVKMVSVRMTKNEVESLESLIRAYDEDLSRSDFIREAIFTYAEQIKSKKVVNA